MNKKNKTTAIIIVILAVGAVAYFVFFGRSGPGLNQSASTAGTLSGGVVGQRAPDFSLPDINGNVVKLSDLRGKNVLLFFNEGEMCYPACWNQIEALGNDSRFNAPDVAAFSIVVDSPAQWQRIESQMPQFRKAKILFDTQRNVSQAYGVLSPPSSMHPGSFPGHTYFLIDKQGVIRFFLDDPNMAVRNTQLMEEINKLN